MKGRTVPKFVLPVSNDPMWVSSDGGWGTAVCRKGDNDCVVRAIALTSGLSYDTVVAELKRRGRILGQGTDQEVFAPFLKALSYERISHPPVANCPRLRLRAFAECAGFGRFIVSIPGHVTTVIDGKVHEESAPAWNAVVSLSWKALAPLRSAV